MVHLYTVYLLNASELDSQFVESLKALFKDKEIEITVSEVDETAYLLRSEANKQHLLEAIRNVDNQTGLVEVQLDALS